MFFFVYHDQQNPVKVYTKVQIQMDVNNKQYHPEQESNLIIILYKNFRILTCLLDLVALAVCV